MSDAIAFGLGALLDILEREPDLTMHVALWQMRLGASLVGSLRGKEILRDCAQVDWYPCLSGLANKCRCQVVRNPQSSTHPFLAICTRTPATCKPTPLTEADLYTLTISRAALTRELRRAFGLTGQVMCVQEDGAPDVQRIGTLKDRPVFLALGPASQALEFWLAGCGQAFVMVPIGSGLSELTRVHCAKGHPVELITLESVLDVTEDGLVANWPVAPVEKELSSRVHSTPEVAEPPAYVALDENGSRELTGREYLALTADPSRYALFLDMIGVTRGGGCRASKVDRDGTVVPVVLSRAEAAVVVELVQAGHSMRPGEFRSVAATHVVKILERARHKLDISFGRYEWRAIQTLRANNRGAKAFQFHPPATMKWLVVVELDTSESTAATRSR